MAVDIKKHLTKHNLCDIMFIRDKFFIGGK